MSARILIVDDTPLNVKLIAAKLAHDYYVVSTAGNGVEALAKVAQEKPDLILLDVMMPEMDGFETCRRLKADPTTAHIPVVILTALSDLADRVRGLAAGADDFLSKPISDIPLMARIRSLLRTKILMDEWRLREATALQLAPLSENLNQHVLEIENSSILIISDNAGDNDTLQRALSPLKAHIMHVGSMAEAEALLASRPFDLIFSDLALKDEDGLTICPRMRVNPATRYLPILLLGDADDITRVAKGLELGANDYILRPFDAHELFARVRNQLRHKRSYDRLRHGFEESVMLALVDPLTNAFNRRYLDAHMPRYLRRAKDTDKKLCVQMIDIDHFKLVNDQYGHAAGDMVLREIAHRMARAIRPSDFFVRMGGEEFAVVMPETELENAFKVAERLRQRVARAPFKVGDDKPPVTVTISIGVAELQADDAPTATRLFERADTALYRAKQSGRNRIEAEAATIKRSLSS